MTSIISKKQEELNDLCRRFNVKRFELFGSAATDRFDDTRSDLDFLVEFEPLTPADHAACYFGLLSALQDLFQRNVDLVETRAIRNPYSKEDIESSRVLVYGA